MAFVAHQSQGLKNLSIDLNVNHVGRASQIGEMLSLLQNVAFAFLQGSAGARLLAQARNVHFRFRVFPALFSPSWRRLRDFKTLKTHIYPGNFFAARFGMRLRNKVPRCSEPTRADRLQFDIIVEETLASPLFACPGELALVGFWESYP